MAEDPITAAIDLGGDVVNAAAGIIGKTISTTQTRQLDAANQKANDDVENFKKALLSGDLASVNLRLGGLQSGISVDVTPAESEQLKSITFTVDGFSVLGLYCRGRAADLAAERAQIISDTASTTGGK